MHHLVARFLSVAVLQPVTFFSGKSSSINHAMLSIDRGILAYVVSLFRAILGLNCDRSTGFVHFAYCALAGFQSIFAEVLHCYSGFIGTSSYVTNHHMRPLFACHVGLDPGLCDSTGDRFGRCYGGLGSELENLLG